MTVAFDAWSNSGFEVDPSWTHSPAGTPGAVLVGLVGDDGAVVSSVSYGGQALSPVISRTAASGELGGRTVAWYLLGSDVPSGAQTVSIDLSGDRATAYAITLTATGNVEAVDSDAVDSGSQANPSVTLQLDGRDCFVTILFNSGQGDVTAITPLTDWTARNEEDFGSSTEGFYTYDIVGSDDVEAGYAQSADDVVMAAIAVSEAEEADTSLAASAAASAAAAAELTTAIRLQSAASAVAGGAAALTTSIPLQASASLQGAVSADLATAIRLQAAAAGSAVATAALSDGGLRASASAGMTVAAALTTSIRLQASAPIAGAAAAGLATGIRLRATAQGAAAAAPELTTAIRLTAAAAISGEGAAALATSIRLRSAAAGAAAASCSLATSIPLTSSASVTASAIATLSAGVSTIQAAAVCTAVVSAELSTSIALRSSAAAACTAIAELVTGGPLEIPLEILDRTSVVFPAARSVTPPAPRRTVALFVERGVDYPEPYRVVVPDGYGLKALH